MYASTQSRREREEEEGEGREGGQAIGEKKAQREKPEDGLCVGGGGKRERERERVQRLPPRQKETSTYRISSIRIWSFGLASLCAEKREGQSLERKVREFIQ